jgi:hypothetical protein
VAWLFAAGASSAGISVRERTRLGTSLARYWASALASLTASEALRPLGVSAFCVFGTSKRVPGVTTFARSTPVPAAMLVTTRISASVLRPTWPRLRMSPRLATPRVSEVTTRGTAATKTRYAKIPPAGSARYLSTHSNHPCFAVQTKPEPREERPA